MKSVEDYVAVIYSYHGDGIVFKDYSWLLFITTDLSREKKQAMMKY